MESNTAMSKLRFLKACIGLNPNSTSRASKAARNALRIPKGPAIRFQRRQDRCQEFFIGSPPMN